MTISLISPDNSDNVIGNVICFGFYIPTYTSRLIFKLDIDTVNTFNSGNLMSYEQRYSQAIWKYYENSLWNQMEETLIIGHSGQEARCIINKYRESNFPELETNYYWRIGASDDMGEDVTYNNFVFGQVVLGNTHRGLYGDIVWGSYIYD